MRDLRCGRQVLPIPNTPKHAPKPLSAKTTLGLAGHIYPKRASDAETHARKLIVSIQEHAPEGRGDYVPQAECAPIQGKASSNVGAAVF